MARPEDRENLFIGTDDRRFGVMGLPRDLSSEPPEPDLPPLYGDDEEVPDNWASARRQRYAQLRGVISDATPREPIVPRSMPPRSTIPLLYPESNRGPVTFAAPDEASSFAESLKQASAVYLHSGVKGIAGELISDLFTRPEAVGDLAGAAERQTRLVETAFSQAEAREEAYDRRIKAVETVTGMRLENPERGGYSPTEMERRALGPEVLTHTSAWPGRQRFESELAKLRVDHPDAAEALIFGSIDEEARAISKGAEADYERARRETPLSTPSSLIAQFGGAMWGMRRDPLFVGSLFAGPTGAVGASVGARIASSALMQGFYNAGITAVEQPAVQAWRAELGLKSGLAPALEHTGMAFMFGLIPGAILRGLHELSAPVRQSVERVLAGRAEPGDIEAALKASGAQVTPEQSAAIRLGAEIDEADRVTRPPPAKDIAPELHDDLMAAAQRYADDPVGSPSPAAVAYVDELGAGFTPPQLRKLLDEETEQVINMWHAAKEPLPANASEHYKSTMRAYARELDKVGVWQARTEDEVRDILFEKRGERVKPTKPETLELRAEISDRLAEAAPRTEREAQMAASEALEDIGNRQSIASTRAQMEAERLSAPTAGFTTAKGSTYVLHEDGTTTRNKAARSDPGHEGDSGPKSRSARTVYVDDPRMASALSAAGLEGLGPKGARVVIKDGKGSLLWWNEKAGAWGRSELSTDIPISETPAVGKAPLELWKKTDEFPGYEAYRGMHAGNAITEMRPGTVPPPARSKDPLDMIPISDAKGKPDTITPRQAARVGERETALAAIIRECK